MKSFLRIALPLVLLVGAVFGLTILMNYDPPKPNEKNDKKGSANKKDGEVFYRLVDDRYRSVYPSTESVNEPYWLKHWKFDYEVNEKGFYDYWFAYRTNKPLTVNMVTVNCQCAGSEMAVADSSEVDKFLQLNYAAAVVGGGGGSILEIGAAALLGQHLSGRFQPLMERAQNAKEGKPVNQTVPAGSKDQPQVGIVRMQWKGNPGAPERTISGEIDMTPEGEATRRQQLEAKIRISPAYMVLAGDLSPNLKLAPIGPGGKQSVDFIVFSQTRDVMTIKSNILDMDEYADCIELPTKHPELTDLEMSDLLRKLNPVGTAQMKIRSAYRGSIVFHESRTVKVDGKEKTARLDMGPLDFRLKIDVENGGTAEPKWISSLVQGDILLEGQSVSNDRTNMGSDLSNSVDQVKTATVIGLRQGIDLKYIEAASSRKVKAILEADDQIKDGRKRWKLTVTIPKGELTGALPTNTYIILEGGGRRYRVGISGNCINSPF